MRNSNVFNLRGAGDEDDWFAFDQPKATSSKSNAREEADEAPVKRGRGRPPKASTLSERLRGVSPVRKSAAASRAAAKVDESPEERAKVISIIEAFNASDRFGPILKRSGIHLTGLERKSLEELQELRERINKCCSSGGANSGAVQGMCIFGGGLMESVSQVPAFKRRADLTGYQAALGANDELAAICEQIEIDSGFKASMSPSKRLMYCMGMTAAQVAIMNKVMGGRGAALPQQQGVPQQQQQQQQMQPQQPVQSPLLASLIAEQDQQQQQQPMSEMMMQSTLPTMLPLEHPSMQMQEPHNMMPFSIQQQAEPVFPPMMQPMQYDPTWQPGPQYPPPDLWRPQWQTYDPYMPAPRPADRNC